MSVVACSELLTTDEAAKVLRVEPNTLRVWRCTKRHRIPVVKVGRLVRYSRAALEGWMKANTEGVIPAKD